MIFKKLWRAFAAQINKLANIFWTADPIAQMQYEYDQAVEELKSGRTGLEQYRALVERCSRQVSRDESHVKNLEAKVKAYLQTGDRETAAKFPAIDRVNEVLPADLLRIEIGITGETARLFRLTATGTKTAALIADLHDKLT